MFSADFERLDEGKQAKLVEVLDRSGPQEFILRLRGQGPDCSDKCVVEVRNGGEIPGVAGQGAREETGYVVDKMGDDDFDNFQGKPSGRGRPSPGPGSSLAPNSFGGEQLDHCG